MYSRLETEKHKEHGDLRQENEILRSKIVKLGEELQLSQRELHKERRGKVMDLTLGTSGDLSEDITNPCRESELKNRYEKLRQNHWAKLLFQFKNEKSKELRKQAEQLIKDVLQQSQDYIQDIVNTMKHLSPSSQVDSSNTKATQYFDLSIQNLQMAIYHEKMGLCNTDKLQRVPEVLRPIVEECYKTGCLMALHNPPLLLDFNNCKQGPFPPIKTNQPCDAEEVNEKCSDPTVFITIDLGTEFSGYYFSIAGSEEVWQPKWGEEYGFNTPKTPTCILFDENKKFLDFGYDAGITYTNTQKDEAKKLYLFENFKRELHGKELHRDVMLTARNGKQMSAMKVFSESLRFMKDHGLEIIRKHTSGVKHSASDATWILTVPAIWSAAAKQFMREAATEAGLVTESEPDRLIIALEPEAASVRCRQLRSEDFMEEDLTEQEAIKEVPGTQHMMVDCGGVNTNITDAEEVDEKSTDHTVFIAIDLGTEFSGYCFSIAGSKEVFQPTWGEEYGFKTPKTPTCILFNENKKFVQFGYDAEMIYTRQTQKDKAKKLYLFDNFKMELLRKELHRDVMITSKNGKQMSAMKVFSESLRFMKDHALEMIGKHTSRVKYSASDATWILTVPAIWSAAAKQFMREAATEAGLVTESESDRLIITLEHEAASVWCRQLPSEDLTEAQVMKEVPGTQYMVVDCGGVNMNITVHEVMQGGHLKELNWATKTFENGISVDKHFKECLRIFFSEKMCDALEEKHPSDLQKLMYDYNGDFKLNLEQLVRKVEDKGAGSRGSAETQGRILQIGDKLKFLHDNRMRSIESQIREILDDRKLNINYMFLVGGFALSPYVNSFIRERFRRRCKVLCPADAQMAVLRGAVTFGMRQNVVESRISRYTYGIRIVEEFDQIRHRGKHKHTTKEGKVYCDDCFHCFVQKDESVRFNEVSEFNFTLIERDQTSVQFDLYYTESKSARFVDERGMVKIGSLAVSMPVIKSGSPRSLQLQVKFGCPEMQATVRDLNTGEIGSVKLALMSK